MARSLEKFPVSEKGFSLPVRDVLTGRGFVTGKSGSGKSNTASVIAEELLERGLGLMIIDTDGEYEALKERYELLQVGADQHCDREITAEDAALVADLALDENVPIILDVSGYMDEEVAQDVIHAVVRELFVKEKQCQKPFLLFVEEAHEFIPERGGGDDLHKMLVRVAKRGRKRGLGICAMSQRPAAVAKDYITQCDWLVWHRLTWENDTKVAGRILGGDARDSVQSLGDGEALVMTDWDEKISRVQFRRKKTVDKGSTPDLYDAYGPPSTREDHVTRHETDGADADDAAGVPDGATAGEPDGATAGEPDGATAGEPGGATSEEPDGAAASEPNGATAGELDADDASVAGYPADDGITFEDGATDAVVSDGEDPAVEPEESVAEPDDASKSNWDLSDVDIEPRRSSPTDPPGGAPPAGSGSAPAESGSAPAGSGSAPVRSQQAPVVNHSAQADDRTAHGTEPRPDQAIDGEPAAAPARRARPTLEEPDEYDPLWEIGQLIVYCYVTVASVHARLVRRIDAFFVARFVGLRRRAFGTRRPPGRRSASRTRRLDRRLARLLSVTLVVAFYALVVVAVAATITA